MQLKARYLTLNTTFMGFLSFRIVIDFLLAYMINNKFNKSGPKYTGFTTHTSATNRQHENKIFPPRVDIDQYIHLHLPRYPSVLAH